jgi:N-methylhydantoinase A
MMGRRIGIDVGGTFTDFLVLEENGTRIVHKTSSVPSDPATAVTRGLKEIAERQGKELEDFIAGIDTIVHGTTVTTNALLTRRGAKVGLITTEGFRDVLPMRDGTREEAYDNRYAPPTPLVTRDVTRPVRGRIDVEGAEIIPLAEGDVRDAARSFQEAGVDSVAISFMHSYADPTHEQRAAEILRQELPGVYITTSSDLISQSGYYDRTSTAVLNSYAGPIISDYLRVLTETLEAVNFRGVLLLMQSNGGVATPSELSTRAALSLLSGPASGPTAGLLEVEAHGRDRCLTVDMGGTSFDAAIVDNGRPLVMTDGSIDRWRIALPMVDIHTIGAGGGSIAAVDDGGILRVGPQSAGAVPGPICYRRGGDKPTTTDADVVLGYIAPGSFRVTGGMDLDVESARKAIAEQIGTPLGLDAIQAAAGIYDVVNVSMAAGVRGVTVRRGLDPRDFPLVVAGGAGPVHAAAIARELEIPLLVVPRESSIFCAAGMLVCDFKHDYVQSVSGKLHEMDGEDIASIWQAMAGRGREVLVGEGVAQEHISFVPQLDLHYKGQWFDITVPVDASMLSVPDLTTVASLFHKAHDIQFGYHTETMPIEVLNVRLTALGAVPRHGGGAEGDMPLSGGASLVGHREIWSPELRRMVRAEVHTAMRLGPGDQVQGPAVVEMDTTTLVVLDEFELLVDLTGSFVLCRKDRAEELLPLIRTKADQAVEEAAWTR